MTKKCPFNEKKCSESCNLFRRGFRYYELTDKKPEVVEICAINLIADCLENMIGRTIGVQQELNLVRNSSEKVANIFEDLVNKANQTKRLEE